MRRFLFLFVFIPSIFFTVDAQAQLLIEEGKIQLDVESSQTIMDSLSVHNTSDKAMNIKIYWEDFIYLPPFDGSKKFVPPGSTEYSCHQWISFQPKELSLPPYGNGKINYSIKVPADVQGGYYGVLFFETGPKKTEGRVGINVITRVGSLFFLESKDKIKETYVSDLVAEKNDIKGMFLNKSNVILIPEGVFYILDAEGLVVHRGKIKSFYLPPQKQAKFQIPLDPKLKPGKYNIILTFKLGDGDSLVKEIDFKKDDAANIAIEAVRD